MIFSKFAQFIVRRSAWVLVFLGLVTAVACALAVRIEFDFSPQSMFTGSGDLVQQAEWAKEMFGYEDAVLMVVLEAVGETDVLDRRAITWQAAVADEMSELPKVREVQTLARLQRPQLVLRGGTPTQELVPVIRQFPADAADEARLRTLVNQTPLLEGSMIGADKRVAALLVMVDPAAREVEEMRPVVEAVQAALTNHPTPEGYEVHLAGLPAVRLDIVDNLQDDQESLIPIAGIMYLLALGIIFRRVSGTLLPLLAVGMGLVWTLATLAATNQPLNLVSNVLPMLLLIIGISNCVHVICRYAEESEHDRHDRRGATERTITNMAAACLLTLLTTAVGFASLWTARSDALQDFGSQAALGLVFLYFSIILTLGATLWYLEAPRFRSERHARTAWLLRPLTAAGYASAKHPAITLLASTTVVLGALWAASRVEINSYALETYDESHPTIQTMRLVDNRLGGILPLEIVLSADDPNRFLEPEVFRKVYRLEQYALEHEAVKFGRSYVDLHREIEARITGDDALRDQLPASTEEGQRRIDRSTRFIRKSADQLHYDSFVSNDGHHARVLLKVRDVGSKRLVSLIDDLEARLDELFPPESGVEYLLTGDAYLSTRAMDTMIRDLLYSLLVASFVILGIVAILFRSPRVALITSLPNLTPLILTAGYMGLRGFDMNAGNVIVFTISLGIAVDNTIHLLLRFREEFAHNRGVVNAVQHAIHGTGRAIVITSVLIVLGLAVLLLSDFVPTRRFAELVSVTMVAALLGDLVLLPASLTLLWKERSDKPGAPSDSMMVPEQREFV